LAAAPASSTPETVFDAITTDGTPLLTVDSPDRSRVFVATTTGIDVIDAITLRKYAFLPIAGGVTALAVDPDGNFLYAAGVGTITIFNIDPGSDQFDKVVKTLNLAAINRVGGGVVNALPNATGYISTLAVSADGAELYVGVPGSQFFAGPNPYSAGGRQQSYIDVIDVNSADAPAAGAKNTKGYWQLIGMNTSAGLDIYQITPSLTAADLEYTTLADLNSGLHSIIVDPTSTSKNFIFHIDTNPVTSASAGTRGATPGVPNLGLSAYAIGITNQTVTAPGGIVVGSYETITNDQYFDLDIRNASGVAITPDQQWAFVADYGIPYDFYTSQSSTGNQFAEDMESMHDTGS
jgi:hypothetical protein